MAYEAQQAELVHAALVRASACTKCSWKDIGQNGLKGCRACLREHWRKCYLNRVNLETINSMNKNGQFDNPELIAFCRGMFSDAALERVTCEGGDVVLRSRGSGPPHHVSPAPIWMRGVRKDPMSGVKESTTAERRLKSSEKAEESDICQKTTEHGMLTLSPTVLRSLANSLETTDIQTVLRIVAYIPDPWAYNRYSNSPGR